MKKLVAVIVVSILCGGLAGYVAADFNAPSQEELIEEFYAVENAVYVSPHGLRKMMDKGDESFVLVDLRSQEEYEQEHIIGAVNIPAYKDKDHSDYGAVDRIVGAFAALPKDKEVIVYCYSTPCMTGRKVGKMLAENDIFVKHLGIGWNDWKYDWTAWNHAHEWALTNAEDYVVSGVEPGKKEITNSSTACPIDNAFGC